MSDSDVDGLARALFDATAELGPAASPAEVIAHVKRLQVGLPAEDEFGLMLAWLGKARLLHKLDQHQTPPGSRDDYQVPDFLVVFNYLGKQLPTLVEVKTSTKPALSWRPDYWRKLKAYADALKLPLLVACKWTRMGLWSLADVASFEASSKNMRLPFPKAVQNDLLGILGGNFYYSFQPNVGMHLRFRKDERLPSTEPNTESFRATIVEAYFHNSKGEKRSKMDNWLFPMFLESNHETKTVDQDTFFEQDYLIADPSPMQSAYRLIPQLCRGSELGTPPPWRQLLRTCDFVVRCPELRRAISGEFNTGMLQYVIDYQPAQIPDYLCSKKEGA